jgi:hypothetical protein
LYVAVKPLLISRVSLSLKTDQSQEFRPCLSEGREWRRKAGVVEPSTWEDCAGGVYSPLLKCDEKRGSLTSPLVDGDGYPVVTGVVGEIDALGNLARPDDQGDENDEAASNSL